MMRRDLLAALKELDDAMSKAGQKCPVCGTALSARVELTRARVVQIVMDAKPDLELD